MDAGNTAWLLGATALVLFMTPGLALFYGGMVRAKNVLNMLMMNMWCLLIIPIVWWAVGYSLSLNGGGAWIGNFGRAAMKGVSLTEPEGASEMLVMIFLATFAAITPALISGAVADRMKFAAWMVFVPVWSLLVYAPVTHWVAASNGWLKELGSLDFAGGTSIHVNAGVAALAVVLVLGRRRGWPGEGAPPHSMPLVMLGTGILWFGWFGFNAGSALAADGTAIGAFVNTFLAACAAGMAWGLVELARDGHVTNLGIASGIVAGLVAITPACGFVPPWAAIVIGIVAGVVCSYAVSLKFKLGYDDSLDVVGVHLVGGLVGSLLIGLFSDPSAFGIPVGRGAGFAGEGLFFGGGPRLLGVQLVANGATMIYSFAVTFGIAKALDAMIGLRVTPEAENEGLDVVEHAETAYSQAERSMGRSLST